MEDEVGLQSDDFIVYGTAVEQLADDETGSSKPVPIQEQVATDEKGRRRFHGAFTGGFSAGFFNTVGSIEGWTPRTFQSSRQKKGEASQQRPEDFMDTEDLGAHGIAPKRIVTTDSFASRLTEESRTYGVRPSDADLPLKALLAPLKESYGVVLLKKMGWKPGQGIGPRLTKRQKYNRLLKMGQIQKILSEETLQMEEKLSAGKLFAPDDTKLTKIDPKSNFYGIGYKGLEVSSHFFQSTPQRFSLFDLPETSSSLSASSASSALSVPTALVRQRKVRGMTGQAFGVGAFENDDEDIYTMDDMSRYDRVLGEAEKTAARKEAQKSIEAPGAAKVVEGFQRSTIPLHQPKIFPPPVLPRGFTGQHGAMILPVPDEALNRTEQGFKQHDAKSRSAALDDPPAAPPVVKSIFDLIPENQKNRIPIFQKTEKNEKTEKFQKTEKNEKIQKNETKNNFNEEKIKSAISEAAVSGVSGVSQTASVEELRRNNLALFSGASVTAASKITFQPFAKDPPKQQRYELFLQRRHIKGTVALAEIWMDVGTSMTEWEREREKAEFFRAAALYRPMSGVMAARFTRQTDTGEVSNEVEVSVDTGTVDKERKTAVEKKLYGKLTRDAFEWHPDRLVCKRFNIPNPYPTSALVGIIKVKRDKFSMFNFLNVPEGPPKTEEDPTPPTPLPPLDPLDPLAPLDTPLSSGTAPLSATDLAAEPKKLFLPEKTNFFEKTNFSEKNVLSEKSTRFISIQPEVEIPTERPPMDIFRAIFDTSDVEEENNEPDELNEPTEPDEPTEPTEPNEPTEPTELTEPNEPTELKMSELSESKLSEGDPFQGLFETNKRMRLLEKKDYPVRPERAGPVVGPEKPSAEILAKFAILKNEMKKRRFGENSSDADRSKKKKKREKSKKSEKSEKKHKKSKKRHKKDKSRRSSYDSTDSDTPLTLTPLTPLTPLTLRPPVTVKEKPTSVRVPATESSPDVEDEDLSRKLRAVLPGKRLTAADFM